MTPRNPSDRPVSPPQAAGQAAAIGRDAAVTPGAARRAPVADAVPGSGRSLSQPPPGGEGEAQSSRPGRAQEPAPGAGTSGLQGEKWAVAVRKATADLHKAQRNRRGQWRPKGRNPFGTASGVRIPPPGGAA